MKCLLTLLQQLVLAEPSKSGLRSGYVLSLAKKLAISGAVRAYVNFLETSSCNTDKYCLGQYGETGCTGNIAITVRVRRCVMGLLQDNKYSHVQPPLK